MHQINLKVTFFQSVFFSVAVLFCAQALSSGPEASEQIGDISEEQAPIVKYSGVAKVGTAVHGWISDMVATTIDYPVPYSIEISGELALEGFAGPEEFALFAEPRLGRDDKQGNELEGSSTETWDPGVVIPTPNDPGTPNSNISGTQCGVMFGFPPQQANIDYTWEWKQTDTNRNGGIDPNDEWGWHLTSYSVNFPAEAQSVDC